MAKELKITRFFHRTKKEVFDYWTRPELFAKWAAFDGMTVKINRWEAKKNGKYTIINTCAEGQYVCDGYFSEFIPNEKLKQLDSVQGPDGKSFIHDLESVTDFKSTAGGTEVIITQRGFPDEETRNECLQAWEECLINLDMLLGESNFKEGVRI